MKVGNIRILEGKSLLWDDITKHYKKKIYEEDYIVMHQFDMERLNKLSTTKPFFSQYYIVELHINKVTTKIMSVLRKLSTCEWISFIFVCNNKDSFEVLKQVSDGSFNGYKISEKYWTGYVLSRITVDNRFNLSNAYKSLGGRFELTDIVIDMINNSGGTCTMRQLTEKIGKRDVMSMDMMWFSILMKDNKAKGRVFKLLDEYRFGFAFIYDTLCNKYKETMDMYKAFREGKFNNYMVTEYRKESKQSMWKLKEYISIFGDISFDELLIVGRLIECFKVKSTSDMFSLVGMLYNRDNLEAVRVYG